MDPFSQITERIIKAQESIIGPIAVEQAQKVPGLVFDKKANKITISGNKTQVVEQLIEKYQALFGKASVDVCKDAAKDFIAKLPKDQVPPLLLS